MIQRIQSVYLLLVAILLVVALCLPVGQFIGPDGIAAHIFKPLGVTLADGNFQSTWGLFGILLLSAIIALCTIFLFRNRMLQVRMTVFGSLLCSGSSFTNTPTALMCGSRCSLSRAASISDTCRRLSANTKPIKSGFVSFAASISALRVSPQNFSFILWPP